MLISEPFFFSKIKFFATACVKKYAPLKFVFITTSKSWNTVSTEAECFAMPAEFTKMSKVSNFEIVSEVFTISLISNSRILTSNSFFSI